MTFLRALPCPYKGDLWREGDLEWCWSGAELKPAIFWEQQRGDIGKTSCNICMYIYIYMYMYSSLYNVYVHVMFHYVVGLSYYDIYIYMYLHFAIVLIYDIVSYDMI